MPGELRSSDQVIEPLSNRTFRVSGNPALEALNNQSNTG